MGHLHQQMCHSDTQVLKYLTQKTKHTKTSLSCHEKRKCNLFSVCNCVGDFGPVLRELAPTANGRAVFVSWSWPGNKHWSTSGGELLYYVLEWTSVPMAELQWQKLAKDHNSASITGREHLPFRHKDNRQPVYTHRNTHSEIKQNLVLHHVKKPPMFYP